MCEALRLLEIQQLGEPTTAMPESLYDPNETRAVFSRVRSQLRLQP